MKVLFFYKNEGYPGGMNCNRIHLYGKGLQAKGVDLEIIIPSNRKYLTEGVYEGIKYSTIKNPIFKSNYVLNKISSIYAAFYYAYYCFKSVKKYDIFLIYGFKWFAAFLIIVGIHLGGSKAILEANENPYSPEGGRLDPVWLRKILRQLTLHFPYKFADGFIVISESLEKLINNYKKKNANITYIPTITDKTSATINKSRSQKDPFILHAGALSETKDGVIAMFEGFAKACGQISVQLKFILTIKAMHPLLLKKVESIINKNGLNERVIFKGSIPKEEVDELKRSCTTVIINKPSNWQNDYNFPGKLGELLIEGVPVIASSTGEMGKYLKDNETAFVVPANDSDAIAEKIVYILNNPDIAYRVGQNGKKLALEQFYYMNYSDKLTDFFKRLAN